MAFVKNSKGHFAWVTTADEEPGTFYPTKQEAMTARPKKAKAQAPETTDAETTDGAPELSGGYTEETGTLE